MSDEFTKAMARIKANDPNFKKVNLDGLKLTNENVKYLFEALKGNTICKELSIKNNAFDERCAEYLSNMIRINKTLELLDFDENKFTPKALDTVLLALKTNNSIIDFVSPYDVSTDEQLDKIDEILDRNINATTKPKEEIVVKEVTSYDASLVASGDIKYVLELINANSTDLLELDLQEKGVTNEQCEKLCIALQKNTNLKNLNLKGNKFDDMVGKYITDMIKTNHSITCLNLEGNGLKKSLDQIIGALDGNKTLTEFPLRGAKFQNDRIDFFMNRNAGKPTTSTSGSSKKEEKLVMSKVSSCDVDYIIQCLIANHSELKSLDFSKKSIGDDVAIKLCDAGCGNNQLKKFLLTGNNLGQKSVSAIVDMIKNTHLERLVLDGNNFDEKDISQFIEAVEFNHTLTTLTLDDSKVDYDAMVKLEDFIERNEKNVKSSTPVVAQIKSKQPQAKIESKTVVEKKLEPKPVVEKKLEAKPTPVVQKKEEVKFVPKPLSEEPEFQLDPLTALIIKIESNQATLKEVVMSGKRLQDDEGIKIVNALKSNHQVIKLDLKDNNQLTDSFFSALADMIKVNKALELIDLDQVKISSRSIDVIITALQTNQVLIDLYIWEECASDSQLDAIYDLLDRNAGLEKPKIQPTPVVKTVEVVQPVKSTFDKARVTKGDVKYIIEKIKENSPDIVEIPLAEKPITSEEAQELLTALKANKYVKSVSLASTKLDGNIVDPLMGILVGNSTLESIDIDFIPLNSIEIDMLLKALDKNSTIVDFLFDIDSASEKQLDKLDELLDRNAKKAVAQQKPTHRLSTLTRRDSVKPAPIKEEIKVEPDVVKPKEEPKPEPVVIAQPMEEPKPEPVVVSKPKEDVTFDASRVKSGDLAYVCQLLNENNTKLTEVDLESTELDVEDAKKIVKALISNTQCSTLNIMNCGLDDEIVPLLCELILENHTLDDLQIDGNDFGEESYDQILDSLEKNTTILCLLMGEDDSNEEQQARMEEYIDRNEKIALDKKRQEKLQKADSMKKIEVVKPKEVEAPKEVEKPKSKFPVESFPPALLKARSERLQKRANRVPKKLSPQERAQIRENRLAKLNETEPVQIPVQRKPVETKPVETRHVETKPVQPVNRTERRQSRIVMLEKLPEPKPSQVLNEPQVLPDVGRKERRQSRLSVIGTRPPVFEEEKPVEKPVEIQPEVTGRARSRSRLERVEERGRDRLNTLQPGQVAPKLGAAMSIFEKKPEPKKEEPIQPKKEVKIITKPVATVQPTIPVVAFDDEVATKLNDLKDQTNPTDYVILEYGDNSGVKLHVAQSGTGGFSEINGMVLGEGDHMVMFIIWRVFGMGKLGNAKPSMKCALVGWEGKQANSTLKSYMTDHLEQVKKFVTGFFTLSSSKKIGQSTDFTQAKVFPALEIINFKKMEELSKPEVKVEVTKKWDIPTKSVQVPGNQGSKAVETIKTIQKVEEKTLTSTSSDMDLTAFRGKKEIKPYLQELADGKCEFVKLNFGGKKNTHLEFLEKGTHFVEDVAEDIQGGPFMFVFKYKKEFYMLIWWGPECSDDKKTRIKDILEPVKAFVEKSLKIKKMFEATSFDEIDDAIH